MRVESTKAVVEQFLINREAHTRTRGMIDRPEWECVKVGPNFRELRHHGVVLAQSHVITNHALDGTPREETVFYVQRDTSLVPIVVPLLRKAGFRKELVTTASGDVWSKHA